MIVFSIIGTIAIICGGLLAAFSARRPTRLASWLSAYLVLVVGVIQFGLSQGWQQLDAPSSHAVAAFIIYNLGNLAVMIGTAIKLQPRWHALLVNSGGALLAVSMVLLLWAARHAGFSWTLVWFVALVIIVLVSMPIGLFLSSRRRNAG